MKPVKSFRFTLTVVLTLTFFSTLMAFVALNGWGGAFNSPDDQVIEGLTRQGTSSFLKSHAQAYFLLNEVEVGYDNGFDFSRALVIADRAIEELKNAREKYADIITVGTDADYKSDIILKLKMFDYDGFSLSNSLNQSTLNAVKSYLSKGDVLGLFQTHLKMVDDLQDLLTSIRKQLVENKKPPLTDFFNLLQQYSLAVVQGNYGTLIFNNI